MGAKVLKMILAMWKKIAPLWYALARIGGSKITMILVSVLAGIFVVGLITWASSGGSYPLLDTHGQVADQERDLIILTIILGMVVVIPVFIILFVVALKYRAGNPKAAATYSPDYEGNTKLELVWWGIPLIIIGFLSVVTYISTFALDPFKPLESDKKPVNVQVIAMQWKWLFIYPDNNVASLQELVIPEDTPINLTITSDAPMNSFWIPALAGQVYAMSGMSTKLHLVADNTGEYRGSSANISGEGFADMNFVTSVVNEADYEDWLATAQSSEHLTMTEYNELAQPSINPAAKTFVLTEPDLYNRVIMKYMQSGMSH